jgi:hypothetical protein
LLYDWENIGDQNKNFEETDQKYYEQTEKKMKENGWNERKLRRIWEVL